MAFTFEQIDSSERFSTGEYEEDGVKKDLFVCSSGTVNPTSRGLIFEKKKLISHSFGNSFTKQYKNKEDFKQFVEKFKNPTFTDCFEGPLVKLWYDSENKRHLSTTNNMNCENSFWGNREERFGRLFKDNGGDLFEENIDQKDLKELTHHFMIMTNNLFVTLDYNINPNPCVLVYLGSVTKEGEFKFLENDKVFSTLNFPTKDIEGKIFRPSEKNEIIYAIQTLENGSNPYYVKLNSPLTQEEKDVGVDLNLIRSFTGKPMILRTHNEIHKILPYGHQKKLDIIGQINPNISYTIFTLLESCRPKKDAVIDYFEKYDFLFATDMGYFTYLATVYDQKYDILNTYRVRGTDGYDEAKRVSNYHLREFNLIMLLILSIAWSKSKIVIYEYLSYIRFKLRLIDFIVNNRQKIVDDKLSINSETCKEDKRLECHSRALERIRDMATRSYDYAKKSSGSFNQNLKYSLSGFVNNERGASLYKIKKMFDVLTKPKLTHMCDVVPDEEDANTKPTQETQ